MSRKEELLVPGQADLELRQILERCKTLQLATMGSEGPEASYAPFLLHEDALYIFVSQLASHTKNLINASVVGVMLIEDEAESRNLFARNRVALQCVVSEIQTDAESYEQVMLLYRQRHGATVDLLRTLPDFRLFRLDPEKGRLVLGFGRAFRINLPDFRLEAIEAQ
ncbi:HugZ family pyridoxamine 5'-phosphate oxidase [Amphritea japonica]|uniref:Pyridoxamine 5'-phosphate oxidase N-terminal domain-containing protein n=1 Tax=Amphritea japonica ATCC BAA-1530 TaxID=1278309 RepID=A0A7R6PCG3_9GAMM|nr:pyridoxamine 5'-phosphate oxidase family protein [Amphritea japonica]BBB25556.1 conserved hypothetical protein [Amphritea japonica ATCC BAA-1530]